ncbi:MAG: hypothetical protein CMF62_00680 [Magnetococcales bacterium]|nr:hypothetical protein [Magnetococcales bacterium]
MNYLILSYFIFKIVRVLIDKINKTIKKLKNYDMNKLKYISLNDIYKYIFNKQKVVPFPTNNEGGGLSDISDGIFGLKSIDYEELNGTPLKDLIIGTNGYLYDKNEYEKIRDEHYYRYQDKYEYVMDSSKNESELMDNIKKNENEINKLSGDIIDKSKLWLPSLDNRNFNKMHSMINMNELQLPVMNNSMMGMMNMNGLESSNLDNKKS